MSKKSELIKVKSTLPKGKDGGSQIVLSETDERHPDGHGFCADPDKWVAVYPTAKVRELISKGSLVEKGAGDADDETDQTADVVKPEIQEGDTPEKLVDRYDRQTLMTWQKDLELNLPANTSSLKVAEAILTK